jgi:hypothetical protein
LALLLVAQIIAIGIVAPVQPWIWLLPLTLPFAALSIDFQYQRLKEMVAVHLVAAARELKLVRVEGASDKTPRANRETLPVAKQASTVATN